MPEMGGPELVSRLAPIRPRMKIVYVSGYTADAIDHQGMLDEGIEFLSKPVGLDTWSGRCAPCWTGGAGRPWRTRPQAEGRRQLRVRPASLALRAPGHGRPVVVVSRPARTGSPRRRTPPGRTPWWRRTSV